MRVRRAATAIATFVVAVIVALAVPVSQVRLVSTIATCCCPDPSDCHCPHDRGDRGELPSMRACHRTTHDVVSPTAPVFVAAAVAIATEPPRAVPVATQRATAPPDAPDPARPDAPS